MNKLEGGHDSRLRERIQAVLLGWCIASAIIVAGQSFPCYPLRSLLGEILLQLDALLTFLLSCCAFTPLKIGSF